jgi:tetratricopeptide (TPR) repeat protein
VPGTKLGTRYTVLKTLGRGGMGAVYQAYDDELGVAVAIKTILHGDASDAHTLRDQVSRFKSELLLARQVTHKNVVRIHDLGEFSGLKYITMSYVAGETLAALLAREGPLPVPQVLALARQITDGMAAAHDVGVVHRDMKPENVMVTPDGQALIMDFGIASSSQGGSKDGGPIVGTISYMAPEQARGQAVDARADIYAFGLMLYDLLLGRKRQKRHATAMEELRSRFDAPPPPIRPQRDDVPAAFEAVIMRALQPAPADRYADTAALREALATLNDDGTLRPVEKPRARWPAVAASTVLTAILASGIWWWVTPPVVEEKAPVSVLVADFENKTGDPVFDGVVEQALGLGIESASFVTRYPRRDALRVAEGIKPGAKLDEQTARLVALREGVARVLVGSVEPDGERFKITARLLAGGNDQASAETVLSVQAADRNGVLAAVGQLAGDVREALGDEKVGEAPANAQETFTAASLEAAAAYAKAQELQVAGKVEEAIVQYQETLKLDPELGRAYSGLAAQYTNLARTAEAEANYQQALARLDRMTDREKFRTRGSYFLFARKPEQAANEFRALVKAFPHDTSGLSNLALASFQQRDLVEALAQGRRAVAMFPNNVLRQSNVALYALYAGQFEDAVAASLEVHKLNPTHLKAFVARALAQLALGRIDEARATYEALGATSPAGASFAAIGLADLAMVQGRFKDAATLLTVAIKTDVDAGNTTAAAVKRIALAEARLAQGDLVAAGREAEVAGAAAESDSLRAAAGLVLAAAGRSAAAGLLAGTLATSLEVEPQAYGRLVLAELALARKEPRKAVDYAREGQKLADTWQGRVILGRAYLGVNAFPEAYTELEAALKRRGEGTALYLDDVPTARAIPRVHYAMGLAQEGLRSPAAKASFETYVALRGAGDAHTVLDDARRRATAR